MTHAAISRAFGRMNFTIFPLTLICKGQPLATKTAFGVGVFWQLGQSLNVLVRDLVARHAKFNQDATRMIEPHSPVK